VARQLLEVLRDIDLSGVAITAGIDENGNLTAVGGVFEKLKTAARDRSFPAIHTVVASWDQRLENGIGSAPKLM